MDIKVKKADLLGCKSRCLVVAAQSGKLKTPLLQSLDEALEGALSCAVKDKVFSAKSGECLLLHAGDKLAADRILFVGLGRERGSGEEKLRSATGAVASFLQERRLNSCAVALETFSWRHLKGPQVAESVSEGLSLAAYRFHQYRTAEKSELPVLLKEATLLVGAKDNLKEAERGVARAQAICRGVLLARDLVNEPGNVKSPDFLARRAVKVAEEVGLKYSILDRPALEKDGFGAMLAVAQGSSRDPRLIVLEHRGGNGNAKPIALVGKGVVFDSGGISLKPGEKMDEMKMDMAGGAAVIGTMVAAALLKLPVNLVGIVPAVENLPSSTAYRPGDIVTSLSGKTIEVLNTDAEGRLILADALTFSRKFDPRVVIDLATLTGACIIALGHHASAVMGTHSGLIRQLIRAGEHSGERLWELPLWEDYAAQIKSEIADMQNIGGRPAGTITAGAFLQKFADDLTWAHIDIAGTAWEDKGRSYIPRGGTGVGVRLLIEYLSKSE